MARAVTLINAEWTGTDITGDTVLDPDVNLELKAAAEKALAKAEKKTYTEHMFISVSAYDDMGMMMEDAKPVSLCLAENQFGVVVLQGAADMGTPSLKMRTLSVADGDIAANGYVMISAGTKKYDGCVASTPDGLNPVDSDANTAGVQPDGTTNEGRGLDHHPGYRSGLFRNGSADRDCLDGV